jgi:hypothetical protein
MANVYTVQLASLHDLASGASQDFSVPAGFAWIIRDIDATSGASLDLPFLHVEDLVTGGTIAVLAVGGLFLESVQWKGRQAFTYGGGFRLRAENNSWDARVTGYEFAV